MHFSIVSYKSDAETRKLALQVLTMQADAHEKLFLRFNDGRIPEWVTSLPNSQRLLVHSDSENIGFGAGHLSAYDHSLVDYGDWIWCSNPDLTFSDSWLSAARTRLQALPPNVLLAGVPFRGNVSRPASRPQGIQALHFILGILGMKITFPSRPRTPYAVPGPLFAIRKSPTLRPFDPEVFLFFEELILAERVRNANGIASMLDVPPIDHQVGLSRGREPTSLTSFFAGSQTIYLRDHLGWPGLLVNALEAVTRARLRISGGVW